MALLALSVAAHAPRHRLGGRTVPVRHSVA
jgi:hypothetical protein